MEYHGPVITLWFLLDLLLGSLKGSFSVCIVIINILWVFMLRRLLLGNTLPFRTPTLPSFFLLAYCVLMIIPSAIWFSYYEGPATNDYIIAVQILPSFFVLGISLANTSFPSPARAITRFVQSDIFAAKKVNKGKFPLFVFVVVLELAIITTYISQASVIPFFEIFSKNPPSKDEMRFAIYESSPMIIFLYAFVVRVLVPITVLFPLYMMNRYRRTWRPIFWLSLVVGFCITLLTLERQSSLSLICLLILSIYFLQNYRITQRQLICLCTLLIAVGSFVSLAQYSQPLSILSIGDRAVSYGVMRVLLDPSYMTHVIFNLYADHPPLLGATIRVLSLFGIQYEHLTAIGFVADLWVNYRWFGVILGPALLGYILQSIQICFFRVRTVPTMIIYSIMLLAGGWLIYSNMLPTMVLTVFLFGSLFMHTINKLYCYGRI